MIREPRIKLGEHYIYCNPRQKINSQKQYYLQLWDYNWPLTQNNQTYHSYIQQVIRDFRIIYPNIHVELKLLDFANGPAQLEQAIKSNYAPDVYCSAYAIPPFNFKRQIPVGPFLKTREKEIYWSNIIEIMSYQGTLCYFPRFIAPEIWIGNPTLMAAAGLSASKIQNNGWSWQDLAKASSKLPRDKYLLVGNLGTDGFVRQMLARSGQNVNPTARFYPAGELSLTIDFLEMLIRQKAIPADCDRNMLGRFLNDQAMLLGGIKPPLYRFIIERLKSNPMEWQPVLLPIPSRINNSKAILVESGVIAVYRNKKTAGNDHLTAAVKLGQFLSCYPKTAPWESLLFYPAAKIPYQNWLQKMTSNRSLFDQLTKAVVLYDFPSITHFPDKIYSLLNEFFAQKTTGSEVLQKLNSIHP